jgi:sulfatase modifying factor 1
MRKHQIRRAAALASLCFLATACKNKEKNVPPMAEGPAASIPAMTAGPQNQLPAKREAPEKAEKPKADPGCSIEMARVANFCIDRWEVHLVDRKTGQRHPENISPTREIANLKAVSAPDVYPQGHMSQIVARKACQNAGKRLCSPEEWQLACRGPGKRQFPYGKKEDLAACNVDKRHPHILDKIFPDTPHLKRSGREFNHPDLLLEPGYLSVTGGYTRCVTPEGVFDMDGNLSEWVEGKKGENGVFMGDAFSGFGKSGCGRVVDAHVQEYLDYSLGTRCCSNTARGTYLSPRE